MFKNIFTAIASIALIGLSSHAATKANETLQASGHIQWTGSGIGKAHTGTLQLKSGSVEVSGKNITGATFEFDMNSMAWEGDARLIGHLKSADFFDVQKYPTATFKATKVEALHPIAAGLPNYKITGDLTIRDKTDKVTFDAVLTNTNGVWTAKGDFMIPDRTKFGITYNSKKFFDLTKLGEKLINDEIKIGLDVKAMKAEKATATEKTKK